MPNHRTLLKILDFKSNEWAAVKERTIIFALRDYSACCMKNGLEKGKTEMDSVRLAQW